MQAPHELGSRDVRGVLIAEGAALDAEDEAEVLNVLGEVGEREAHGLSLVEVFEFEVLEVAQQEEPGSVALGKCVEVLEGLPARAGEVAPGALLLDEEHSGPEEVDVPVAVVELLDVGLVARDASSAHAEDLEEIVVEALRVALLVRGVAPLVRERGGAGADFIP